MEPKNNNESTRYFSGLNNTRIRWAHNVSKYLIAHSFWGSRKIMKTLARVIAPKPSGSLPINTNRGFYLMIDPTLDKGLETELFYHGTYEDGTLCMIENLLRVGDTFLDIGANIGLMSLTASLAVGESGVVYAFEPVPTTFLILQNNILMSESKNIRIYNIALGSKRERLEIYENIKISRGSASFIRPDGDCKKHDVEVYMLDEINESESLGQVHMMKLDVEGWELEVLKGAVNTLSKKCAPIIIVEYNRFDDNNTRLLKFLTSINNYAIYKLKRGKENISKLQPMISDEDLPIHDNLFCFLPSHLHKAKRNLFSS